MRLVICSILLMWPLPGFTDSFNPDAGRLARFLCHGVNTPGDLSSRDRAFSLVITQEEIKPDRLGNMFDASNFVPGNRNYNVKGSAGADFTVSIHDNVDGLTAAADPYSYAEDLLASKPTLNYPNSEGGRINNSYTFGLGKAGDGSIDINLDNQIYSAYDNRNPSDIRFLVCEAPFSIPMDQGASDS